MMESRLAALLPGTSGHAEAAVTQLPPAQYGAFAAAMGQSLLLPAGVLLAGLVAVLCFAQPLHLRREPAGTVVAGD
jgi:hypothetical protein